MSDVIDVKTGSKARKIVAAVIVLLIVVIIGCGAFTTVRAGHTGVVVTFGKVSSGVLGEGLHLKIPFIQQVVQIDNRVQKAEVDCSSASKDLQTVTSTIALNYKVRNSASADIYQNVGPDFESIIVSPAIQECVKAVTAKYTAEQLITERQSIGDQMKDLLGEKINGYGIDIEIFNIITFEFTDEYNAAIEAKQTAQQNALKAEQDLQRIKVEAEQTVAKAKRDGYVETMFGRRRYIKELAAKNKNLQAFGERVAKNTPIQGTAADIIKIAMIKVYNRLKESGLDARLILQVHDELIVEAKEDCAEKVALLLKEEMENAVKLTVPMTVDVNIGKTWYDTH